MSVSVMSEDLAVVAKGVVFFKRYLQIRSSVSSNGDHKTIKSEVQNDNCATSATKD